LDRNILGRADTNTLHHLKKSITFRVEKLPR
jgi:hypothetical protein